MRLPVQLSLLYLAAFGVYIFLGMYIIGLNFRSLLNRLFFGISLLLCVWSFSFAIANSAVDYETALFWRRVAALGWGPVYSFLLHFIMVLTERNKWLKNRWLYVFLYVPAFINVVIFGLHNEMARQNYHLVQTVAGWANITVNSLWDQFFHLHYAGFTLIGLWLLWEWGRRSQDSVKKQQANLLIISFMTAFIGGSLTDIIGNTLLKDAVPPFAPVFILIPATAIFYSIRRYGLLLPSKKSKTSDEGKILNAENRNKIFQMLSHLFILSSILGFISYYYLHGASIGWSLLFGGMFLFTGMAIQFVRQTKLSEEVQDVISLILMALAIPVTAMCFISHGNTTTLAAPVIFVLLSMVSSKKRIILVLSVIILLTQVLVWVLAPSVTVQVAAPDHIARITIVAMTLWVAFFVNRIYVRRLEENECQIEFQQMITHISADFVTVTEANLNQKIQGMLARIGAYSGVDRAYLFLFSKDLQSMTYTHEWCATGIEAAIDVVQDVPVNTFPWWMAQILDNGVVHIPEVGALPPEAEAEKEILQVQDVKSLVSIPVRSNAGVIGFVGFDAVREPRSWEEGDQELLRVLANILADAVAKVEAEKEIHHLAYYDGLTGLPNRVLFKNRLEQAIHLAVRSETLIGIMLIDLDAFKAVNDTMGHEGGDELLKHIAERLSNSVRKYDTVSRFGGDEFLILFSQISRTEDIRTIAANIMNIFDQPITVKDQEFFITASAGISVYPVDGEDANTLIKNADLAMYVSKEKGKNQYTLCLPDMKEDVLKKMKLINSLYRARERDELVLYYQPQIDIASGKMVGLEALIRWRHPELGMVSPAEFIPLAEQTGLINSIGQWVLQVACRQNKAWQDMGLPPMRIAVNLSVEQFRSMNLVCIVADALSESRLQPQYLELEITENVAIQEGVYTVNALNALKSIGVTISIDDFGTHYSSLSRLKELPIDRIKMAMQFVQGIAVSPKDEAIVRVILHLAQSLGLKVIAEGVETEAQLAFLTKEECAEAQGYYFYRPMPEAEVKILLEASGTHP